MYRPFELSVSFVCAIHALRARLSVIYNFCNIFIYFARRFMWISAFCHFFLCVRMFTYTHINERMEIIEKTILWLFFLQTSTNYYV